MRLKRSRMNDKEKGYSVCHDGKIVALVHNHPSGNINPSVKDMETARKHDVAICVTVHHGGQSQTRCYRPARLAKEK
jgi:proteasome lid subunit RPN8/RPN11